MTYHTVANLPPSDLPANGFRPPLALAEARERINTLLQIAQAEREARDLLAENVLLALHGLREQYEPESPGCIAVTEAMGVVAAKFREAEGAE